MLTQPRFQRAGAGAFQRISSLARHSSARFSLAYAKGIRARHAFAAGAQQLAATRIDLIRRHFRRDARRSLLA